MLVAKIALRRGTSRFLLCTFTPCNLLAAVSYLTFWLHPRLTGFRLAAVGLSLFCALYFSTQHLCPYGELRHGDVYVLIGTAFVVAALVENVIVDHLRRKRNDEERIRLDYLAMALYPLLFACANWTYFAVLTA